MITDQNTIDHLGHREATYFLSCLRSIGKVMAVGVASGGCSGRKSDKDPDFEPPNVFVCWGESTCVHDQSRIAALSPSSLLWDRIYLEITASEP